MTDEPSANGDDFNAYQPPQADAAQAKEDGDSTGGLIPYKNPPALIAYYLGLFSLFPCLGAVLGLTALVLGIIGLRRRNANPAIKGSVHAWIGIIMGGIFGLLWTAVSIVTIIAMIAEQR